ncbi:LysM peptidoglycan-binding domain-containing protein [Ruegeria sp. 2205SS24-7]|uniref:LysM peptidoglycan-binding domain-containing protein n=1 Tax=Ruegeria discodermiae TaxID=3064389 RepID=UPI00274118F5|nr:LysM peptidoglycan-binding domain-containing protein [Ruegeria sp. 2205SS24-7]MDP5215844.1 LysM peptidoglycan-binding domain-containing protein [Ruegeria sp. 2205SS24-7]
MAEHAGGVGGGKTTWAIVAGGAAVAVALVYFLSSQEQPEPEADSSATPEASVAETGEADAVETDAVETDAGEAEVGETTDPDEPSTASEPASDDTAAEVTDRTPAEANPPAPTDTAEAEDTEQRVEAPDTEVVAPELDLIRVEPDGSTTLAGRAAPGSQVQVLVDGDEVHSFEVDQSGQFAALFPITPEDAPRTLTLRAAQGDQAALSDDFVIAAAPKRARDQPAASDQLAANETPAETRPSRESAADTKTGEEEKAADTEETVDIATNDTPASSDDTADAQLAPSDSTDETELAEATPDAAQETTDDAPTILRSDEEGVELVQSPQPQSPAAGQALQLDTIGYTDTGEVELTGRAAGGSTVRVYLDNRAARDLSAAEDGRWRGEIDGIAPGTYTLRLDALGADGKVIDRLETPFRREAPEQLLASDADIETQTATIRAITVQQGDTLWAISRDRYGDGVFYVKVFDANRDSIRNPDLIYPGQIFNLPE